MKDSVQADGKETMQRERKDSGGILGSIQLQYWFKAWLYVQADEKDLATAAHMNNNVLNMENEDLKRLLSCKPRLSGKALVQACLPFALISHGED